jgi:AraC-like DNA-binding protein
LNETGSISSISQIHHLLGLDPPKHPLITLLEEYKIAKSIPEITKPIPSELYSISLKNGSECSIFYGRRKYDFLQGSLLFLAPGQSFITSENSVQEEISNFPGWTLVFHPELIRNSSISKNIEKYTFFNYESNEALHLSKNERLLLTSIIKSIQDEFSKKLDEYSNELIVTYIELLLKNCLRFYGRQFITRSNENHDILIRFETFLRNYFDNEKDSIEMLSVKTCAKEMGYSTNYLSDLLKKETGKSAQEHIYFYVLERAKNMLLSTNEPVNYIASSLGFEYSQHFSKFFKNKIGVSPMLYRKENSKN